MKVLKFGGTSVGTPASIRSLQHIVQSAAETDQVIVVVSALGGITDHLIRTARLAELGDEAWRREHQAMLERHLHMVEAVIAPEHQDALRAEVCELFDQLQSICFGVSLIRDLSEKTLATIVSYGERLSSRIAATLITGAVWHDSRQFIRTEYRDGKHQLATDETNRLIRDTFAQLPSISLVAGFISSDLHSGETTNLGRGGSDYTAAIIAAALGATVLEIWTDVNGFMTADPRVISSAYTIPELTYNEASELCNFGAKVVYPPTLYPVCAKSIPILIKNTFNPSDPGSVISLNTSSDEHSIKGISQISNVSLLTVSGLTMVGVIGVNRRIFSCLAQAGVSTFMVSQANSENSTSIGVREADANIAAEALDREFAYEIRTGSMRETWVQHHLAAVAIVGENMRHRPGIAGRLFSSLGDAGISIVAFAQGAAETNISFIVQQDELPTVLTVVHNSFFCPTRRTIRLVLCGIGTVGGRLLSLIKAQQHVLADEQGIDLKVVGIANSRKVLFCPEGLVLDDAVASLNDAEDNSPHEVIAPAVPLAGKEIVNGQIVNSQIVNGPIVQSYADSAQLLEHVVALKQGHCVFADCTASPRVAELYPALLQHGIHVVAANKLAAAGSYEHYGHLLQLARENGVSFRYETNVGAGLPVVSTISHLRLTGDHITRIEAVLSGTLGYIFSSLAADTPFSEVVRRAQRLGYSEPDPRQDLSGADVAKKILILSREAGYALQPDDVELLPFMPEALMKGSIDDFWSHLSEYDHDWEMRRLQAEAEGKRLRFIASFADGKAHVGLQAVGPEHPFFALCGTDNCIAITSDFYPAQLVIRGAGAGADVTASGVFADIITL